MVPEAGWGTGNGKGGWNWTACSFDQILHVWGSVCLHHTIPAWKTMHFTVHHMVRKPRIWAGKSSLTVSWVLRAAVTSASTHGPEVRIAPPKLSAALAAWTFLRCPQLSSQHPPSSIGVSTLLSRGLCSDDTCHSASSTIMYRGLTYSMFCFMQEGKIDFTKHFQTQDSPVKSRAQNPELYLLSLHRFVSYMLLCTLHNTNTDITFSLSTMIWRRKSQDNPTPVWNYD